MQRNASLERLSSGKETITRVLSSGRGTSAKQGPAKLVEEEQREIGHVSWSIYSLYLTKAFGPWLFILLLIVQTGWQIMMLLSDYWLAYETSDGRQGSFDPGNFIRVYTFLSLGTWVCVFARTVLIILFGARTTQEFYLQMLRSIFRAPMAFFDTTPTGRILSRVWSHSCLNRRSWLICISWLAELRVMFTAHSYCAVLILICAGVGRPIHIRHYVGVLFRFSLSHLLQSFGRDSCHDSNCMAHYSRHASTRICLFLVPGMYFSLLTEHDS